jgi:putative SOS response-associated peptidase YedK
MCGRFRNLKTWADLHSDLQRFLGPIEQAAVNLEAREQVRPTNDVAIVRSIDDRLLVSNARWWLVPWFHKGALKDWKATTFNARAETVATSRAFRDSYKRRRCLVPADGWYEWMGPRDDDGTKKQRKRWLAAAVFVLG